MTNMPDEAGLTELLTLCHQGLDEFFLLHQEAVLIGNLAGAKRLLDCYRELHQLHMNFEDQQLIPKLEELECLGEQGRWQASLYTLEHAKIQELLNKVDSSLLLLQEKQLSGKSLRRGIIALIDREKMFKGVCEHHQEREEAGILPELCVLTDAQWRISIMQPFFLDWSSAMDRNRAVVDAIDWL